MAGSRLALAVLQLLAEAAQAGCPSALLHPRAHDVFWKVDEVKGWVDASCASMIEETGRGGRSLRAACNFAPAPLTEGEGLWESLGWGIGEVLRGKEPRRGESIVEDRVIGEVVETQLRDLRRDAAKKLRTRSVSTGWDEKRRWREAFRCRWRKGGEHNNVLEMHSALQAVRHCVRTRSHWGMIILVITDSLVVLGALGKGRSRSRALLRLCRRMAGLLLATGCTLYLRYVETDRNPADGPSRGFQLGVAPKSETEVRLAEWSKLTNARRQVKDGLRRLEEAGYPERSA